MKVLVISHTVLSRTSNMGKTLRSYFRDFTPEEIAQFYIHSEEPVDDSLCWNYFCFTDRDALRSLLPFRTCGQVFQKQDIRTDRLTTRTDVGFLGALYQLGRKRTAGIFLLRNLLWKCSRWDTGKFWKWVDAVAPDVVFFASGDYGFLYDIAREVAAHVNKPLVVSCVDDFYLYNRNEGSLLGRILHRSFLKTVHKTMERASAVFTVCTPMKEAYEVLFGRKCYVLHTPAARQSFAEHTTGQRIAYIGNLGLKRNEQLAAMGRVLQSINLPGIPRYIDVYSAERNPEILKILTMENGIRFHGAVSAEEAARIMGSSMAVIHTESFDPQMQKITRFSISTKIADTLMNGPCLIAYGPAGIASMDYLRETGAVYTITDPQQLEQGLREILSDVRLRDRIIGRAREVAEKNHSMQTVPGKVRQWLRQVCEEQT